MIPSAFPLFAGSTMDHAFSTPVWASIVASRGGVQEVRDVDITQALPIAYQRRAYVTFARG